MVQSPFSIENTKAFLELLPNPVALLQLEANEQGNFDYLTVHLNALFTHLFGYQLSDVPDKRTWFQTVYPNLSYRNIVTEEWDEAINNVMKQGGGVENLSARIRCLNGKKRWVKFNATFFSESGLTYAIVSLVEVESPKNSALKLQRHLKELKESLSILQEKDSMISELENLAQIGTWEICLTSSNINWSRQMYEIFGEDPDSHIPTMEDFYSRLSLQDQNEVQHKIEMAVTSGKPQTIVVESKRKDGHKIVIEIRGRAKYNKDGQPTHLVGSTMDVSDRTNLEQQSWELANLIKVAQQELYVVDFNTDCYLYANEKACQSTGYSLDELLKSDIYLINPSLTPEKVSVLKKLSEERDSIENESVHRRKNGQTYPVHAFIQRVLYKNRVCYAIFDTDISDLKRAQQDQKDQLSLLQKIVDTVPVRIFWKDLEGKYIGANRLFLRDAELSTQEDIIGKTDYDLVWKNTNAEGYRKDDQKVIKSRRPMLHYQERQVNSKGKERVLSKSKVPLINAQDDVVGVLGAYQDITSRLAIEETLLEQQQELHYRAHFDHLTGLPNRVLLIDRIEHAIQKSKRNKAEFAVLFIDLDHFKQINDSMGHAFGDRVLQEITSRFKNEVRSSDTLARLGGDEFTIVMEDYNNLDAVVALAQKIITVSKEPIIEQGLSYYLSSSIGISVYPKDADDQEKLLKCADAAMYRAKDQGRDSYHFYTEDMTLAAFEHVAMQASLREAIQNCEFEVYFQPQINSLNHKLIGMEALARWQHPYLGIVTPDKFIPLAESIGLIVELDRIIIQMAMEAWSRLVSRGISPGILSINLSVKQAQKQDFIAFVIQTLEKTGCQANWICFELTESLVMENIELVKMTLETLSKMGISIAVDDFGTGYSSLAILKRLPVNKLKIDRSFVVDLPDDEDDKVITKTIIFMGLTLGMGVIAEGVETVAQEVFLLDCGCSEVQGYLYSKPIPIEQVEGYIKDFAVAHVP